MQFSAIVTFAAAVMASPIEVRQEDIRAALDVYHLYTKSNFAQIDNKPLSTFDNRIGIWSNNADPMVVSNSGDLDTIFSVGETASETTLAVKATTRSNGAQTYLKPLIVATRDEAGSTITNDGFKMTLLNETADARFYTVSWTDARSWLAAPVRENADAGTPAGWDIFMRPNTDGVVMQTYMPVEIVAKLVAQS